MKIESIRDLEKIIRSCRKLGVDIIKIGDIEIVLDKSFKASTRQPKRKIEVQGIPLPGGIDETTRIEIPDLIDTPDELTDEEMLFYSAEQTQ